MKDEFIYPYKLSRFSYIIKVKPRKWALMKTISVALEADTIAQLDASAKIHSLSRNATLKEATERMRAADLLLESEVAKGRECIAKGDLYTQAQIELPNTALQDEIMRNK